MISLKRLKKKVGLHKKHSAQKEEKIPGLRLSDPRNTWDMEEQAPTQDDSPCKVRLLSGELGLLSKYFAPAQEDLEDFVVELNTLKKLSHINLLKTLEAFHWDSHLWVIRERSLQTYDLVTVLACVGSLTEPQLSYVVRCTCLALQHLHNDLIIHRDINSSNITVGADGSVKLGGLTNCAQLPCMEDQLDTCVGTAHWMAPEMALSDARMASYGYKVDIWSLGITVLELAEGEPPHFSTPSRRVLTKIAKSPPPFLLHPQKFSTQLAAFLSQCLVVEPYRRAETGLLLEHPFFLESSGTSASVSDLVLHYEATQGGSRAEQELPVATKAASGVIQDSPNRVSISSSNSTELEISDLPISEPQIRKHHSITTPYLSVLSKIRGTETALNINVPKEHKSKLAACHQDSMAGMNEANIEDTYQPNQSKKKLHRLHVKIPNKIKSLQNEAENSTLQNSTELKRLHDNSPSVKQDIRTTRHEIYDATDNTSSLGEKKFEETVEQTSPSSDTLKKTVTFSPSTKSAVSECLPTEDNDPWLPLNEHDPFTVYCPEIDNTSLFATLKSTSEQEKIDTLNWTPQNQSNGQELYSSKNNDDWFNRTQKEGTTQGTVAIENEIDNITISADASLNSNVLKLSPNTIKSLAPSDYTENDPSGDGRPQFQDLPSSLNSAAVEKETSQNQSNKFSKGRRQMTKK